MRWLMALLVLSGLCLFLVPQEASAGEKNRRTWFANQEPIYLFPPLPRRFLFWGPEEADPYAEEYDDQYYEPQPRKKQKKATAKKTAPDGKASAKASPASAKPAAPEKPKAAAVTCDKAQGIVSEFGFQDVKPASCTGKVYAFSAVRDGKSYSVKLDSDSGELTEVKKQP